MSVYLGSSKVSINTGQRSKFGVKNVTTNGTYDASNDNVDGYNRVVVNVPSGITPTGTKNISITSNGTTTEDVTNYASASITTNVANSYAVSDEGKVVSNGGLVSQTSATYSTNDTYDTTTVNSVTVNVPVLEEDPADAVRFFDYDGTVVYQYSAAQFLALSAMPANPSHTGLVAQGWNYTLQDAQDFVEQWGYLDIGQMYITQSGDTEIDIEFPTGFKRLEPYLGIAVNGEVEIDWGDNSTVSTVTGSSLTTQIRTQHIYSNTGKYTITIHVVSGSFAFYGTSIYFLLSANNSSGDYNKVYSNLIKFIRIGNNCTIGSRAFYYCYSLEYITVPQEIYYSIGSYAFAYCYSLKYISLPKINNLSIGTNTFSSCCSLKNISLPKSIGSISSSSFSICNALESLIINFSGQINAMYRGTSSSFTHTFFRLIVSKQKLKIILKPYILDSELLNEQTSISSSLFGSCIILKEIIIPNTITSIESYAFAYCQKLNVINIPQSVTSIGSNAFQYCHSLSSIQIPQNVTSIGNTVFQYCYSLSSIQIPQNVTSIGDNAFDGCYSLSLIQLPQSITSIGNSIFYYCYSLSSIQIPQNVTSIGNYAFYNCYSLSSIQIPQNVTSIGANAFNGCYGMKEYHFKPTTPPTITNTNVFSGIPSDCIIYVPQGSLTAYQTENYWSTYASQMQEEPAS